MKLLMLLYFVLAVSGIHGYVANELTQILRLTQRVHQYVSECVDEFEDGEYKVNKHAVTALLSSEEDQSVEKVTHCFFLKAGILEPDGKLNPDAALSMLSLIGVDENEADELLQRCTSITGIDANETAYAIFKCFEDGFKPY